MTDPNQFQSTDAGSESTLPQENAQFSSEKFKGYGKKSLTPLIELFSKYKSDIIPYSTSLNRAFDGAISALKTEQAADHDQKIVQWLEDAKGWIAGASDRFQHGSPKEVLDYIEEVAGKNPWLSFSASYLAGLMIGRVGRYAGHVAGSTGQGAETSFGTNPGASSGSEQQIH